MENRTRLSVCAAIFALGVSLPTQGSASGVPPAQELPAVFATLVGEWTGEGTLFGREARYEMEWTQTLNDSFVHLRFSNAFVGESAGELVPVISASAYYRPDPDAATQARGAWFDTRGVMLPLSASVSADALVTLWGDETSVERGRTTYRVVGPNRVEVTDEVMREGEYAAFARADFIRAE